MTNLKTQLALLTVLIGIVILGSGQSEAGGQVKRVADSRFEVMKYTSGLR